MKIRWPVSLILLVKLVAMPMFLEESHNDEQLIKPSHRSTILVKISSALSGIMRLEC